MEAIGGLFTGFGILNHNRANIRQLDFARVPKSDRHNFVAVIEKLERFFPTGRADKIGNDENEGTPPDRIQRGLEQDREVSRG